ncbi:MAG: hypothetical protein HKO65_18670 [Gemmatimonadetes bacterium]|nr:hypothetical protein [Gemmatimonadota bacterium]NNM07123.1 hypothetical protein [Gemmatimonadota bacterium]
MHDNTDRKSRIHPDRRGEIHPGFLVALVLVLALVIWSGQGNFSEESSVPLETVLQETIYVTALALEAEFQETGAYPTDLESLGLDDEGLTYTLGPNRYTLVASAEGASVEYRSGGDLAPFREAFEHLLPPFPEGD